MAFTDRFGGVSQPPFDSLDLSGAGEGREAEFAANFSRLAEAFEVRGFATMRQVHGGDVCIVGSSTTTQPTCDALVTDAAGVALCVRVADCVPVVLADVDAGVIGVAHAGRPGVVAGIVPAAVDAMRALGASTIEAWIGPHVCGGCYEVPAKMRAEVADVVPASFASTTWGTPSVDLGAAVTAQLQERECIVTDASRCTRESDDLYSYRRGGTNSGRFAGIAVLRGSDYV